MPKALALIPIIVAAMICVSGSVSYGYGSPVHIRMIPQTNLQSVSSDAQNPKQPPGCITECSVAPMGIADFGYNGNTNTAYSYAAHALRASVTFTSFNIKNVSCYAASGCTGDPGGNGTGCLGLQLNAIENNVLVKDGLSEYNGTYWTQNTIGIQQNGLPSATYSDDCDSRGNYLSEPTNTYTVDAETNIWNFTTSDVGMGPAGSPGNAFLTGGLNNNCSPFITGGGSNSFYGCTSNGYYVTKLPFRIVMLMWTGTFSATSAPSLTYAHDAFVKFSFALYNGTGTSHLVANTTYDEVAFNGVQSPLHPPKYVVSDTTTPLGYLTYDAENVICGPGNAALTAFNSISATLFLQYEATEGSPFLNVPHAYSFGGETGEFAIGVAETYGGVVSSHRIASAGTGTDSFVSLY